MGTDIREASGQQASRGELLAFGQHSDRVAYPADCWRHRAWGGGDALWGGGDALALATMSSDPAIMAAISEYRPAVGLASVQFF